MKNKILLTYVKLQGRGRESDGKGKNIITKVSHENRHFSSNPAVSSISPRPLTSECPDDRFLAWIFWLFTSIDSDFYRWDFPSCSPCLIWAQQFDWRTRLRSQESGLFNKHHLSLTPSAATRLRTAACTLVDGGEWGVRPASCRLAQTDASPASISTANWI